MYVLVPTSPFSPWNHATCCQRLPWKPDLINAWVYAIVVKGWNDLAVLVDSTQLSEMECSQESGGLASHGWSCLFSSMPHLCIFDTPEVSYIRSYFLVVALKHTENYARDCFLWWFQLLQDRLTRLSRRCDLSLDRRTNMMFGRRCGNSTWIRQGFRLKTTQRRTGSRNRWEGSGGQTFPRRSRRWKSTDAVLRL